MEWSTLITTSDYAVGVICLARSLLLVGSRFGLVCYIPNELVKQAIADAATANGLGYPECLRVELLPNWLYDDVFVKDLERDSSQFIDAPRRFLFRHGKPFVFLDSDMIVTQNIDNVINECLQASREASKFNGKDIIAVPNFRNKKRGYGNETGNFNAGMMAVPRPQEADYNEMIRILSAGYNDTEEKLLNLVFRDRWAALPIGYNCQKRAFKLAPSVWNAVRASPEGIKVVHYVGAKPWQSEADIQRLDWEGGSEEAMGAYRPLFDLWHKVFAGEITTAEQVLEAVPEAVVS